MERDKIILSEEAKYFLDDLAEELMFADYYSFIDSAENLVNDITEFINHISGVAHYELTEKAVKRFARLGEKLEYAFFKRSSSRQTTWYIFFLKKGDRYIIRYITNNHKDGAYIR